MKTLFLRFAIAIVGGLLSAITFAATVDRELQINALIQPGVLPIALGVGLVLGTLISPLVIWSFRNKNMKFSVLLVYSTTLLVIISLNVLEVKHSMLFSFIFSLCMIIGYGSLGKNSVKRN